MALALSPSFLALRSALCSALLFALALDLPSPMRRRVGEGKPAGWPAGRRPVFRQDRDVLSKNPVAHPRTFRASARKAPHRGGLSFGYFSLATQRKVTRCPAGQRHARRVGGTLAVTPHASDSALASKAQRAD